MSSTGLHNFDHAVHTANTWLVDVAKESGQADDRPRAYRLVRAWLHTLRDRLPVDVAANMGAQLPVLLRGVYYEGWAPHSMPQKYGPSEYVHRFADEASIAEEEVEQASRAVTTVVLRHTSPGELDTVLHTLPHDLRPLLEAQA
jgi:uncharacterized protein (DUF2267 family)